MAIHGVRGPDGAIRRLTGVAHTHQNKLANPKVTPLNYISAMGKFEPETALVWADVTEFTLAMEADEPLMARQTVVWVARCVQGWLPDLKGRFLQQAGDAILLSFDQAESALQAARRLQQDWAELAPPGTGHSHELRTALHWGRLMQGPQGYVAHSLNQLARLAQQVPAGRIWGSETFWRHLPATAQCDAVDLGWMHFKHLTHPIRVFELTSRRQPPQTRGGLDAPMWPRLLVHGGSPDREDDWGMQWVQHLSATPDLHVAAWSGAAIADTSAACLLASGADYVLARQSQTRGRWRVTLLATPHGLPIRSWDGDPLDPQDPAVPHRIAEMVGALRAHGLSLARSQPSSAMGPGLLRSAALGLMHAGDLGDFERADLWLQAWQSRYARSAQPHVWRALWQVMRHTRGLEHPRADLAMAHVREALRMNPEDPHAWATRGFARAHLRGELQEGMRDLERAQVMDPALGWIGLYRSALWSMLSEPRRALVDARQALARTSEDALHGYALGLAGHAALFAGQAVQAGLWLEASWRKHRHHSPTLRMLVAAHQMMGQSSVARLFLRELMLLEPQLTARTYLGRARAGHARRAEMAHWLILAGLPLK